MRFFYIFIAISALLAVSAIPLPNGPSVTTELNPHSILYRRHPPDPPEGGNANKRARFAGAADGCGGNGNNHPGESSTPCGPQHEPPKFVRLRFSSRVPSQQDVEIIPKITNYHRALRRNRPDSVEIKRGRGIRVVNGWRPRDGLIKDSANFTYHSDEIGTSQNIIGGLHRVFRPMTVSFSEKVPQHHLASIETTFRAHHADLADHRAKTANVAVVAHGWHPIDPKGSNTYHRLGVRYYHVPDHASSMDDSKDLGEVILMVPTIAAAA